MWRFCSLVVHVLKQGETKVLVLTYINIMSIGTHKNSEIAKSANKGMCSGHHGLFEV